MTCTGATSPGLTAKVGEPAHHFGELLSGDGLELVGLHGVVDRFLSGDYRRRSVSG